MLVKHKNFIYTISPDKVTTAKITENKN